MQIKVLIEGKMNMDEIIARLEKDNFVQVVRCKDCTYYTGKWCTKYSTKQFDINDICMADNDFCSRAERKDDETD